MKYLVKTLKISRLDSSKHKNYLTIYFIFKKKIILLQAENDEDEGIEIVRHKI